MSKSVEFEPFSLTSLEEEVFGSGSPVVTITAAIHGEEQTSVYVARKLISYLRGRPLLGTVRILPVCNPTAFRFRQRTSPVDSADLNRSFGVQGTSHSFRLAKRIWEEVKDSDYLLDLHCCGTWGSTYAMSQHTEYDHQYALAKAIGLKNVILSGGAPGQLFLEMNKSGKKSMLIEIRGGQPAAAVDIAEGDSVFQAVLRFLNFTGVGSFSAAEGAEPVFHNRIRRVLAEEDGFLRPLVSGGTDVKAGEPLAEWNSTPLTAPFDGTVLAMTFAGYLFSGDRIYTIAPYMNRKEA